MDGAGIPLFVSRLQNADYEADILLGEKMDRYTEVQSAFNNMSRSKALSCLCDNNEDPDYNCDFVFNNIRIGCPCDVGIPDECMEKDCRSCWTLAIIKNK